MEQKQKEIGAIWAKQGQRGEYLSITVEIDGVKHNFTAFQSNFYIEGGNKPKYYIPQPKSRDGGNSPNSYRSQVTETVKVDKYQSQLDAVMARKEAMKQAALKELNDRPIEVTEQDVPF